MQRNLKFVRANREQESNREKERGKRESEQGRQSDMASGQVIEKLSGLGARAQTFDCNLIPGQAQA